MCKITSSGWFGRARSQVMDGLDYSLLWLTIHNLKFCPKFKKTEMRAGGLTAREPQPMCC